MNRRRIPDQVWDVTGYFEGNRERPREHGEHRFNVQKSRGSATDFYLTKPDKSRVSLLSELDKKCPPIQRSGGHFSVLRD